jgi:NADH:ubiquinone oxidoreductase subunit 3 (subunit A)
MWRMLMLSLSNHGIKVMTEDLTLKYSSVILVTLIGALAIGMMLVTNLLLAPRKKSLEKELPFECGIPASPFSWSQIHMRYYIFAILFLIFDVEVVFLLPWILIFMQPITMSPWVFYEMVFFIAILLFGIVYSWQKGMLKWK